MIKKSSAPDPNKLYPATDFGKIRQKRLEIKEIRSYVEKLKDLPGGAPLPNWSDLSIGDRFAIAVRLIPAAQRDELLGKSESHMRRYERGTDIPLTVVAALAAETQIPMEWIVSGKAMDRQPKMLTVPRFGFSEDARPMDTIPVIGIAEAGAFRTADKFGHDHALDNQPLHAARSVAYPAARHFSLRVQDDSMNASKPPIVAGSYVLCVDLIDAELEVETGKIYVVRKTRDGGQTHEWTIKRARVFKDRVELHPESTNPKHETITIPRNAAPGDGMEVAAMGWVYGGLHSYEA